MPRLTICTYHWGKGYGDAYIQNLERGFRRYLRTPFRFRVLRYDRPIASDGTHRCFPKLNLYRTDIGLHGIVLGADLDLLITEDITDEIQAGMDAARAGKFLGCRIERRLGGRITHSLPGHHECRINSSLVMFHANEFDYLWHDFPGHYNPHAHRNDELFLFDRLRAHGAKVSQWDPRFISRFDDGIDAKILAYTGPGNQEKLWLAQSKLDLKRKSEIV